MTTRILRENPAIFAVLIGVESRQGFGAALMGQLAILVAALSYACAAIYGRRFQGLNPLVVATGMLCRSTVMMAPLVLRWSEPPWHLSPGAATLAALFGLAAFSTALAYLIYFRVLATAGATNILLVTFLIPISAILLGYLVLGERLVWNAFAGMGLVFFGLMAIDGRLLGQSRRKMSR